MSSNNSKATLRKEAAERRAALKAQVPELSRRIAQQLLQSVPIPANAVVSAYWAIGDEADPAPAIAEFRARGHRIVLPRVTGRNRPLDFHLFEAGAKLVPGGFGLSEPSPDWPRLAPDVLIVPFLAFDSQGYRIGYGAGYYDRTLRELRQQKAITAAGYGFAIQEFAALPHMDHDERLDWIVTEHRAHKVT
jgi:5-formyltetrahydrofolate cyclo-ligase